MKFGQELKKKWTHEWATEYLDYSGLKSNSMNNLSINFRPNDKDDILQYPVKFGKKDCIFRETRENSARRLYK